MRCLSIAHCSAKLKLLHCHSSRAGGKPHKCRIVATAALLHGTCGTFSLILW